MLVAMSRSIDGTCVREEHLEQLTVTHCCLRIKIVYSPIKELDCSSINDVLNGTIDLTAPLLNPLLTLSVLCPQ